MEANELRIGNYVTYKGLFNKDNSLFEIEDGWEIDDSGLYDPIPLTEEWILKFKEFGKLEEKKYFNGDDIMILCDNDVFIVYSHGELNGDLWYIKRIHFVHQLQNIVWILTGNELTIKTK